MDRVAGRDPQGQKGAQAAAGSGAGPQKRVEAEEEEEDKKAMMDQMRDRLEALRI